MSTITITDAPLAMVKRNLMLPSHYQNCSLQQLSRKCFLSVYPAFPAAIELTTYDSELRAVWPCEEIVSYCTQVQYWQSKQDDLYKFNSLVAYDPANPAATIRRTFGGKVLAPIGLILNIMLFVTFCSPRMKGRVLWYLRAIALTQVCQAIEKITADPDIGLASLAFIVGTNRSFIFVILYGLTNMFPFFKQVGIAMGAFASVERFVSVFAKVEITKRIHKRCFFGAIVLSSVIGTLTFFNIVLVWYDAKVGRWVWDPYSRWDTIRIWIYDYISTSFVAAFDIASIIVALIFTICVNVKLIRRSRKVATMMATASVKDELKRTMDYARFQTLDTIALLIDLCSTLFVQLGFAIAKMIPDCRSRECLFPSAVRRMMIWYQIALQASYVFDIYGGFCHAELFFFYLIFSRKFRDAHLALWRDAYKKLRSMRC